MQDQHAGKAGTFYVDPKTGKRVTEEQWLKQQKEQAKIKPKKTTHQE